MQGKYVIQKVISTVGRYIPLYWFNRYILLLPLPDNLGKLLSSLTYLLIYVQTLHEPSISIESKQYVSCVKQYDTPHVYISNPHKTFQQCSLACNKSSHTYLPSITFKYKSLNLKNPNLARLSCEFAYWSIWAASVICRWNDFHIDSLEFKHNNELQYCYPMWYLWCKRFI